MAVLEVNNIEKHFGKTKVIEDVSFSLEEGNALAIIGSSGSGKTTLLRCLNFLEKPNKGEIFVKGEKLLDTDDKIKEKDKALRIKRLHFGMVFQNFNLFPQYTALENVTLAERLLAKERTDYKTNKKEILDGIGKHGAELLAQVGLADRMSHYPHQLSGGQQQRVAIARALALDPDILCFDEPTSALDPELTGEVLRVIRDLKRVGKTMIIVTHEMEFAKNVADYVIYMADGVIEEEGTPEEIFERPKSEKLQNFLKNSLEEIA